MSQLTDTEYVKKRGTECPYCGGTDLVTYDSFEFDEDRAVHAIECENCGKIYQDLYKLSGYEDLDEAFERINPQAHS